MNKAILASLLVGFVVFSMGTALGEGAYCYEYGTTRIGRVLQKQIIEAYDGEEIQGLQRGRKTFVFASKSKFSTWTSGTYTIRYQGQNYGLFQINLVTQDENVAKRLELVMQDDTIALCHSGQDYSLVPTRVQLPVRDLGSLAVEGFLSREDDVNSSRYFRILNQVELVRCNPGDGLIAYGLDTRHGIPAPQWMGGTLKAGCGRL
ncbi:MAG: hypothetical protein H6624_19570 [Bdellovibrionaceae bacterium]|nr:hypothetical protein [Bdellovibrionales bacterium]MCB9086549.1 hypothetical protein [Pseudobdellovibrionaceae bacterium]